MNNISKHLPSKSKVVHVMSDENLMQVISRTTGFPIDKVLNATMFLGKLLGENIVELNEIPKDFIKYLRFSSQVRLLMKAKEKLESAGINPNRVPLKTIIPLLEYASLEEEETLHDKWANLLANASKDSEEHKYVIFCKILSELTPYCALFLINLYTKGNVDHITRKDIIKIENDLNLSETEGDFSLNNLLRLKLIDISESDEISRSGLDSLKRNIKSVIDIASTSVNDLSEYAISSSAEKTDYLNKIIVEIDDMELRVHYKDHEYFFTELGFQFVHSIEPPKNF